MLVINLPDNLHHINPGIFTFNIYGVNINKDAIALTYDINIKTCATPTCYSGIIDDSGVKGVTKITL